MAPITPTVRAISAFFRISVSGSIPQEFIPKGNSGCTRDDFPGCSDPTQAWSQTYEGHQSVVLSHEMQEGLPLYRNSLGHAGLKS